MAIKILIADDHGVVAEGLKHLVEAQADMEVVACVGDGREAVQQSRDLQPDVVLMDLSMPELNGADATRAIEMVCNYLERTEPTNPAQLLLRRAGKLINKNFLELVREFAPDAVNEVARVMGVSPEEFFGDSH